MWISLAISDGFVSMLLYLSVMQSRGGASWLLNIFLCIRFGLISYNCLYLFMAFLIQYLVNLVVIVRACVFVVLAIVAIVMSHSCCWGSWIGKGGMLAYAWFKSVSIMGCDCQFIVCFAR